MRRASGHNYRNSSFIVDVAMGQIGLLGSTEHISSFNVGLIYLSSMSLILLYYCCLWAMLPDSK